MGSLAVALAQGRDDRLDSSRPGVSFASLDDSVRSPLFGEGAEKDDKRSAAEEGFVSV